MSQPLLLVSGATRTKRPAGTGYLVRPGSGNASSSLPLQPGRWAMDNGAFSGFDPGAFMRMLQRFQHVPGCLFVAAPDVIGPIDGRGDAAATLDLWPFWSCVIRAIGFKPALVAQDGLTVESTPWDELGALFVGGSTAFKESVTMRTLIGYAKAQGLWVHWGRVNGKRRYELALKAGCDSFDGTGFSWFPDTRIPMVAEWDVSIREQPELGL